MSSSYLVSDKLYYFANEDITQKFSFLILKKFLNAFFSFPSKSSLNPSPLKKFKIEETVIESVAYLEADQLPQEKEYKDLGREYFDFIYVFNQPFNNDKLFFFFGYSKNINEEIRLNALIRLCFLIFGRVLKINRLIKNIYCSHVILSISSATKRG